MNESYESESLEFKQEFSAHSEVADSVSKGDESELGSSCSEEEYWEVSENYKPSVPADPSVFAGMVNEYCDYNLKLLHDLGLYTDPEEAERERQEAERKRVAAERRRIAAAQLEEKMKELRANARRSNRIAGVETNFCEIDEDGFRVYEGDDGDDEYSGRRQYREYQVVKRERSERSGGGAWGVMMYKEKGKERYSQKHLDDLGTCVTPYPNMREEKVYDKEEGSTCHQCRQKIIGRKSECSKCHTMYGMFCGTCLQARYGENLLEVFKNPKWTCPTCRGFCNCSICRNELGYGATGAMAHVARKKGYPSVAHYLVCMNFVDPETGLKTPLNPDKTPIDGAGEKPGDAKKSKTDSDEQEKGEKTPDHELVLELDDPLTLKKEEASGKSAGGKKKHVGKKKQEKSKKGTRRRLHKDLEDDELEQDDYLDGEKTGSLVVRSVKYRKSTPASSFDATATPTTERLPKVMSASASLEDLELPFVSGNFKVNSFGMLDATLSGFHNTYQLLPVGYRCVYSTPRFSEKKKGIMKVDSYVCCIETQGQYPLFRVGLMGSPTSFTGATPTSAWRKMLESILTPAAFAKAVNSGFDGLVFFGLHDRKIKNVIESLPGQSLFVQYKMKVSGPRWVLKKGDRIAVRTSLDEKDRFWLATVVEEKDVAVPHKGKSGQIAINWFEKTSGKGQVYVQDTRLDRIDISSIFHAQFDGIKKVGKSKYRLVESLEHHNI